MINSYWVVHHLSNTTCPTWVIVLISLALVGFIGYIVYDMVTWDK